MRELMEVEASYSKLPSIAGNPTYEQQAALP